MSSPLTRRRLLGVTGGSLLGGLVLGPRRGATDHVDPASADGWRQPRTDARNVAWTADPGPGPVPDSGSDAGGVEIGWEYSLEDHRRFEHAGLALAAGTLLVPAHRSLRGVDAEDGAERFRYAYRRSRPVHWPDREQLDTEPRVRDGVAYVVFQTTVCALDLETRRLRWRCELNSGDDGLHLFGNTVYVTALVDGDQRLVALDATTGLERWRRPGRITPLAAVSGLLVGARYDDGRLIGLDPTSGERRWESDATISASSLSRGRVVAVDDRIVAIEPNGDLTALDATDGDRRWTVPDETGDRSRYEDSIAVDPSDQAIYWSRPAAARLDRLDLEGTTRWKKERSPLAFGVSVGSETVYASTADGLLALAADSGDERFAVSPDGIEGDAAGSTPLITGDRVYHLLEETVYEVRPR